LIASANSVGYPGSEFDIRAAMADVVGQAKSDYFFDKVCSPDPLSTYMNTNAPLKFLEYFFQDADAAFFKSCGLNCIRIAFNYRHFEGAFGVFFPSQLDLIGEPMSR
jgi:hypothetical protein